MHAKAVWAAALALSGAANVAAMSYAEHIEITRALANKPVKRDVDRYIAIQKRDLRMQQHQQALVNIEHNSNDPEAIARQEALLKAAQQMEASAMQRKKRAGTAGSDISMVDLFDGNVDILYMANISIGTPAQVFSVVPDTGSADLWVPSTAVNDPNHNEFNSGASSTFVNSQETFVDTYGLGRAAGRIVADTITFGEYTIRNKTFGLATQTDSQFKQQANDGIIGMANSLLSNQSVYTFFERLIMNNTISNPYFGVYLARGRDTTNQPGYISGSNLCLGCMATPVSGVSTTGSMNYVNVAPARAASPINLFYFYEIPLNGIYYNGANITGTYTQCIIDTGTTALYFPTTVADNMMAKVNGRRQSDGSYIVPASSIQSSTSFGVSLGGTVYNISMLDLIDGYTDNSRQSFLMNVYAADTPDPNGAPLAILGDVFIKNVLTVYSYSTNGVPAVGFQQLSASSNGAGATGTVQSGSGLPPGVPTGSRTGSNTLGNTATAAATSRNAAQSKVGGSPLPALVVSGATVLLATLFGGLIV